MIIKRLYYLLLTFVLIFSFLPISQAAQDPCAGIKPGQKVYWDGMLLTGQIGLLSVLQDTPLVTFKDGETIQSKILKKGSSYKIYTFKPDYYGVGGGYYVKRDSRVSYKTPSKQKLQAYVCANPATQPEQNPPTDSALGKPVDLGPQVFNLSTLTSRAGMDKNGNANLYIILHGTPTALAVVDLNTNTVTGVYPLANSTSAWALDVDHDGVVWIGGTTNPNLYRFDPTTKILKDFGNVGASTSDTSIQDLTVTDQYVYVTTAYGSNMIKINKQSGKKEAVIKTNNGKLARSLAVDPDDQNIYISSGPEADIQKWNAATNTKQSILNENYRKDSYADKMRRMDNVLAMKMYPSKVLKIYDVTTGAYINEYMADSRAFSLKNEQTGEFYFTYKGVFYGYNASFNEFRNTHVSIPGGKNALSIDFVTLKENPNQQVLTGIIDNDGNYYIFNPVTNQLTVKNIKPPAQPVDLYSVFSDPDGKNIYANGFMTGGLTKYDPITNTGTQLSSVMQLESAVFINGKMYGGVYPKAKLIEVTPGATWSNSKTREVIVLEKYGQERITAMTSYDNRLFAGTFPLNTTKGGLLFRYDLATNTPVIYEDYMPNQSIITLMPDGKYMYGGTTVFANYVRSADPAQFFRFNPLYPEEKELIPLPVKASLVMSLIKGPDGNIWGAADGTIFSYNQETNSFRTVKLLNSISGNFSNAKLLAAKDGLIVGTIEGRLFKVNPADMSYKIILDKGAYDLAEDSEGNFYYRNAATLYKINLKEK